MIEYSPRKHLLSLHIPKCGGKSLGQILGDWFGDRYYIHYYDHQQDRAPLAVPLKKWGLPIRNVCIHGHFMNSINCATDIYPTTTQFLTFFRDPLDLAVSLYYYQVLLIQNGGGRMYFRKREFTEPIYIDTVSGEVKQSVDVHDYLEHSEFPITEFIPFELNIGNYEEVLNRHFVHVGCMANYGRSVQILAEKLGRPVPDQLPMLNVGSGKVPVSSSIADQFYSRHQLALALYEFSVRNIESY